MRPRMANIVFALLLIVGLPSGASADDAGASITVSGTGELAIEADRAALTLSISHHGSNIADLERLASAQVTKVLSALEVLGVASNTIDTTGIQITPRSRYDQATQRRIDDGFHLQRQITIVLEDLSILGQLMQRVTTLGVNGVSPPRVYSSKHEQAYLRALRGAIAQAKRRAEAIAEASGSRLGGLQRVNVNRGHTPQPQRMLRSAAMADADSNSFEAGELRGRADLTATYALDET